MSDRLFKETSRTTEAKMTKLKLKEFEWVIEDFTAKTGMITSPMFDGLTNGCKWFLVLSPDGDNESEKGYLSLFLYQDKFSRRSRPYVHVSYKLHIANTSKNVNATYGEDHTFDDWCGIGVGKMIDRKTVLDQSSGFLVDDKLTIICELTLIEYKPLTSDEGLLSKQEKIFNAKEFTDCVFICRDGIEIPAWKVFLASNSPVFRAMFNCEMEEAKTGRINVNDTSSDVMQELCRFTCCGKIKNLSKLADELLVAADKYEIVELKNICADEMRSSLSKENVLYRLVIADRHDIANLKEAALYFIKENGLDINRIKNLNVLLSKSLFVC